MGAKHKVKAFIDHANLAYYRHPQKVNRRVARYIATLTDYDLELVHRPGAQNKADALSRRPDYDNGQADNKDVTALPDTLFVRHLETLDIHQQVLDAQRLSSMNFSSFLDVKMSDDVWLHGSQIVVPEDLSL
jgi:hypothetical protein